MKSSSNVRFWRAAKGFQRKIPCCHTLEERALRSTTLAPPLCFAPSAPNKITFFLPWPLALVTVTFNTGTHYKYAYYSMDSSTSLSKKKSYRPHTPIDDADPLNPFNPASSSPQERGDTSHQSNLGYQPSQYASFPQFNQQFQSQFPRNFSPYGMPPNYHPYGGFHPGIPYCNTLSGYSGRRPGYSGHGVPSLYKFYPLGPTII